MVKSENVEEYLKEGVTSSIDNIDKLREEGEAFLAHKCSNRYLVKTQNVELRCRMPKCVHMTLDNTKNHFVELPMNASDECWMRLNKCGLANESSDENENRNKFKCSLECFYPKRWIPPMFPGENPISPFESKTICVCRSMQNFQRLHQARDYYKHCCKYLAKFDKQNIVNVSTHKDEKETITTNSTYLRDTKITSSDMHQKKSKIREKMHIVHKLHALHHRKCCR